jgi:hypothetical protein
MQNFWKPASAVVAAAIIAGAITGFPGLSPEPAKASATARVVKAPIVTLDNTSDRGWPYTASNFRLVTTDRLN